jgi:hypothetical protein
VLRAPHDGRFHSGRWTTINSRERAISLRWHGVHHTHRCLQRRLHQKLRGSFDNSIGACQQRNRESNSNGLYSSHIYDEFEFGWLLNR